jgi:hypothetical protein
MPNLPILSFNSGELSPLIDARSDIEKYRSGCRILENMLPRIYGCVERRPGFKYVYETKNSPQGVRLIPFIYNSEIAYMCEFGDLYIRFYYDQAILAAAGVPVEVTTDYLVADLPELQYAQIADVMWLVHGDYAPAKLSRTSATAFAHTDITFTGGPFRTRNDLDAATDYTAMTMDYAVVTGSHITGSTGTLTASAAFFDADHVGALMKLVHKKTTTMVENTTWNTNSSAITIKGDFRIRSHNTWTGTVTIQRSEDAGTTWDTFVQYKGVNDTNIQESHTELMDDIQYRIALANGGTGTIGVEILSLEGTVEGIVKITSITSSTVAKVTIVEPLDPTELTNATKRWAEGCWSAYRGYPNAITFFQQRAIYGGLSEGIATIWLSTTGDFDDFEEGEFDDSSFSIAIPTTNEIRWLASTDKGIVVGTSGDEWLIKSNRVGTPITISNYTIDKMSSVGSCAMQPLEVGNVILFNDYVRRKIREFVYASDTDKFETPDITALAEHITESGIIAQAIQRNPDQIIWNVLNNGYLISFNYDRDQNVIAAARHIVNPTVIDSSGFDYQSASTSPTHIMKEDDHIFLMTGDSGVRLQAGGVARDVGSAYKVGLPSIGHGFVAGDLIHIGGSANYSNATTIINHTVQAETTGNEIVIINGTIGYIAETFTGNEVVTKFKEILGAAFVSNGYPDIDDTYMYVPVQYDATNTTCIARITVSTWAYDGTWTVTPTTAWNATQVGRNAIISDDGLSVYLSTTGVARYYKFLISTGANTWEYRHGIVHAGSGASDCYDIRVDSAGKMYVSNLQKHAAPNSGSYMCARLLATGADVDVYYHTASTANYAIALNEADNIVVFGGDRGTTDKHLYFCDCDTYEPTATVDLGDAVNSSQVIQLLEWDDYFFALSTEETLSGLPQNIWKYDWAGNLIASANIDQANIMWHGNGERLYVAKNAYSYTGYDTVIVLDPDDLSVIETINAGAIVSNTNALTTLDGFLRLYGSDTQTTRTTTALGTVETVAVIPSIDEDEVWITSLIEIEGAPHRYVEVMQPRVWDTREDCFFVDSGIIYDSTATNTISGLDHLEGETVKILGDGAVYADQVVVDGSITLPDSATVSKAQVGLAYTYKVKPMRFDITGGEGTTKGSIKQIPEVVISFLDTLDAQVGAAEDAMFDLEWRTDEAYDSPPDLYTGDMIVCPDGGFGVEDTLFISGSQPLPCTVRCVVPRLEKTGR